MTRAVLFDTETTGLDPLTGHRVIEVAALELVRDLPTGAHFHALIHPGRDIPDDAVQVHGITLDRLAGKPPFAEVADALLDFLGDGQLIAHNAPFDFAFLDAELGLLGRPPLARARMIDTLAMAKTRFPGLPNSLDALCRRFGIDLSERTSHNALLDCRLLAEVYVELTGGRQRALWARGADTVAMARAGAASLAAAAGPAIRRTPRPVMPSAAELAAHAAFVARLADPVWLAS
jgi:DNA polymerase-3 subunit epsilon